jgi:transposase
MTEGAATLAEPEARIVDALAQADVLHCDETGISWRGQRAWLHVVATDRLTHYAPHRKRGAAATEAIGVLPRATGVFMHDAWASYWRYPNRHALCNAHHLRELTAVEEQTGQAWAAQVRTLLVTIKDHVTEAQAAGATALSPAARQAFLAAYTALLDAADQINLPAPAVPGRHGRPKQTPTRNLLDRLRQHQSEVLAFMDDWRIPFDNNQAERDLRMVKVQQKISGTFRSEAGARAFCRWRGYLSTLHKHGLPLLDAITQTLRGQPPLPQLAT